MGGKRCKSSNVKGNRCRRYACGTSEYCTAHDPETAARWKERNRAALRSMGAGDAAARMPMTRDGCEAQIVDVIAGMREGVIKAPEGRVLLDGLKFAIKHLVPAHADGGDEDEMTDEQLLEAMLEQVATIRARIARKKGNGHGMLRREGQAEGHKGAQAEEVGGSWVSPADLLPSDGVSEGETGSVTNQSGETLRYVFRGGRWLRSNASEEADPPEVDENGLEVA